MKTCSIDKCPKPARTRGWCPAHYMRWRKYGDPTYTKYVDRLNGATDEERLVNIGWDVTESGCHEWLGATDSTGYGRVQTAEGVLKGAHQVAYEVWVGPVPKGHVVRHRECDNPPCINPEHLRSGTHQDNMQDKSSAGHHHARKGMSRATLTEAEVRSIRADTSGRNNTETARLYCVSRGTIRNVLNYKTWKHVMVN